MSSILLLVALILYTLEVKKLRREVADLKSQFSIDVDFWGDEECEEKI